jgi:hypothetical protein
MNRKTLVLVLVAAIAMLIITARVYSQTAPPMITTWTDKIDYAPGETGTMYIRFYNDRAGEVDLNRITMIFGSWRAYLNGQWEGNQTIEVNQTVAVNGIYQTDTKFVVPTDGRAKTTSVDVFFETDIPSSPTVWSQTIFISQTPRYNEQVTTLLTVIAVLLIACTVIIAIPIFVLARRTRAISSVKTS